MTIEEVRAKVEAIARQSFDDEVAHSAEDALNEEVLTAIAKGAENPAQLAHEALQTVGIEFSRWCA